MHEPISELSPTSYHSQRKLLNDAETAVAWGIPDSESFGMRPSEFISIISRLISRVKQLERENEQLRSQTH